MIDEKDLSEEELQVTAGLVSLAFASAFAYARAPCVCMLACLGILSFS